MAILDCSVSNCSYNRDNNCCLAAINVGEQGSTNPQHTCCENFIATEYTNSNEVHHPCMAVDIKCMAAGCIHNDNAACTATSVQIGGKQACCSDDTDCLTFCCK